MAKVNTRTFSSLFRSLGLVLVLEESRGELEAN
jgi:hypothetical protein